MDDTQKNPSPTFESEGLSLTTLLRSQSGEQGTNKRESRNSSLDQMRNNLKERIASLGLTPKNRENTQEDTQPTKTTKPSTCKPAESNGNCKDHPDEALQFYSFTNDKILCSECLLSGSFAGCDVVNLKKAAEKIRPKLERLLQEITKKGEQFEECEQKQGSRKKDIDEFVTSLKSEISAKFEELYTALKKKEQDIIEQVDKIKEEKQAEIESKYKSIKDNQEEIGNLKGVLQGKLSDLKDAELCNYYASKEKLIKSFIEEKCNIKPEYLGSNDVFDLKGQYNFNEYQQGLQKLLNSVKDLKGCEQKEIKSFEAKTSELKLFQNRAPRNSSRPSDEISQEYVNQPLITKKILNLNEEPTSYLQPRSISPFGGALRNDIEGMSPVPRSTSTKEGTSPINNTEDTLRRLFEKIGEVRKTPFAQNDLQDSKKDFRNNSFSKLSIDLQSQNVSRVSLVESQNLSKLDNPRDRETPNNFWDNYKVLIEDQGRKRQDLVSSTSKLGTLDRSKTPPKSYIQEFAKSKISTPSEILAKSTKKDYFGSTSSIQSQGLASTKNLRSLIQDETPKQQSSASWKLQMKRTEDLTASSINLNKSLGSSNLSTNLMKLKKQMGLWGDE